MTRLAPYEPRRLDLLRRVSYRVLMFRFGKTITPGRVLAHHRPLMLGYAAIEFALDRCSNSVEERYKYLGMVRTSQLTGCEWCMDFGSKLAQDSGIDADTLQNLSLWRSSPRFDAVDRLVLEYAEGMTRTPVDVTDELFAQLHEHFDERQMVELTMAIALENLYCRSNWAFGIESEEFTDGMYCVRPEAAHPVEAGVGAR